MKNACIHLCTVSNPADSDVPQQSQNSHNPPTDHKEDHQVFIQIYYIVKLK